VAGRPLPSVDRSDLLFNLSDFKWLLVCDCLLLLENKCNLVAVLDTIDCGLAPGRPELWPLCTTLALWTTLQSHVLSRAHPTCPSWPVALPVVHADRVPCNTARLQVEPPSVIRAREEVNWHFPLSICYVDRRKFGRERWVYATKSAVSVYQARATWSQKHRRPWVWERAFLRSVAVRDLH
jgi:hypothetical protein